MNRAALTIRQQLIMYSDLAYLFSAVIHFAIAETQMLQALYDKIYLAKCFENSLEIHFE